MSSRVDTNRVVANDFLNVLSESAKIAFMPLSCGGGIRTRKDAESRLLYGADKIVLNKLLFIDLKPSKTFSFKFILVT